MTGAGGREVVEFKGESGSLVGRLDVVNVKDAGALPAEQAAYRAATTVAREGASP
jgi:hypothetical protein